MRKISSLAENTNSRIVFNEVLAAANKDIATKDVSRLRGGWPLQDAFYAFAQHVVLSGSFLDHVISIVNQTPISKVDKKHGENSGHPVDIGVDDDLFQAAVIALTAFFRGGGKTGRRAVEQSYASVLSTLILHFGSCRTLASTGQQEPLQALQIAFKAFCECVGDLEMGKILAREEDQSENEKWINLIGDLAGCISIRRPKEVVTICVILSKTLDQSVTRQKESAAAALSEFLRHSDNFVSPLEEMIDSLCRHASDGSSTVRRFCLRSLVQMPSTHVANYTSQVLAVILALLDDLDDSVQLAAVGCLMMVLETSSHDVVHPILLNLSVRLCNLQISINTKIRAKAFAAFGALSKFGIGPQHDAFLEQVHVVLPRLVLHLFDDDLHVRLACRSTFKSVVPLMEIEQITVLINSHRLSSEQRF